MMSRRITRLDAVREHVEFLVRAEAEHRVVEFTDLSHLVEKCSLLDKIYFRLYSFEFLCYFFLFLLYFTELRLVSLFGFGIESPESLSGFVFFLSSYFAFQAAHIRVQLGYLMVFVDSLVYSRSDPVRTTMFSLQSPTMYPAYVEKVLQDKLDATELQKRSKKLADTAAKWFPFFLTTLFAVLVVPAIIWPVFYEVITDPSLSRIHVYGLFIVGLLVHLWQIGYRWIYLSARVAVRVEDT